MENNYDCSGWATRANLRCTDGRIIKPNAFKDDDGKKRPLVWMHQHNDPEDVLGHAILENREDGIYAYCKFNNTARGLLAKHLVEHGDVTSLSIFATQLQHQGLNVVHGAIREVSLVLAGANPGAFIDSVIKHGENSDEEAIIYTGGELSLMHSDTVTEEPGVTSDDTTMAHADQEKQPETDETSEMSSDETVGDILSTLTEKQQNAVYGVVGKAIEKGLADESDTTEGGNEEMKHNAFEEKAETNKTNVLSHDAMATIIGDAKRFGSMKESFLQHAATYGIDPVDYLFPEPKTMNNPPEFIQRDMGWVSTVMNGVHRSPFSRIKSIFADITEDDARAKGYMKGKLKKEEVFALLKRSTTPTTIYKKQKMDRDDVIDITDFDVIAWLKREMRMMLEEEIARAILVGDGRSASSDDKISETNIRPIWKDEELFTIKSLTTVSSSATADDKAKAIIRSAIKARKDYKGSGNPTLFTTEDFLTDMLLLTDTTGRDLYDSPQKLAQKLRVSNIVTVPVMEGLTNSDGSSLAGLIVNLSDYNVGADKNGAINMFDDFDIDYNQQKYLIETRCSGALIKPYSAIALELKVSG